MAVVADFLDALFHHLIALELEVWRSPDFTAWGLGRCWLACCGANSAGDIIEYQHAGCSASAGG
jgi:hypothetical protein